AAAAAGIAVHAQHAGVARVIALHRARADGGRDPVLVVQRGIDQQVAAGPGEAGAAPVVVMHVPASVHGVADVMPVVGAGVGPGHGVGEVDQPVVIVRGGIGGRGVLHAEAQEVDQAGAAAHGGD